MKTCTVYGDMQADRASEQYPVVNLCDECHAQELAAEKANGESNLVSTDSTYDPDLGECSSCGKTEEEEKLEVF